MYYRTLIKPYRNFPRTLLFGILLTLVSCIFLLSQQHTAAASTTLYVSLTGSNSNNCLSAAAACSSIDGAWDKCSPGDTIIIKSNVYPGPQTITGDKLAPGCTVTGENGTTIGPLETDGQYFTLENVTIDAGTNHNSGGWASGASHVTLKQVNLHGPYVTVALYNVSDIHWLGGELGRAGITGGKRAVGCTATGDAEPVQIGDADHITFEKINFHPQDADLTPVACSSNGFHLEMIRLDGGTSFFTLRKSVFDSGDHSGTSSIFITTQSPGTNMPHDLVFENNFFGDVDASSGSFNAHSNVSTCKNITVAYNTLRSGDGAWQCTSFDNLKFIGNVGARAASPCTGAYINNVWQDSVDYASGALGAYYVCGTDKVILGTRYSTDALGLASDGFHLMANSPAVNAAETGGYCTNALQLGGEDIDNEIRPSGKACDAGADEYGSSPASGGGGTSGSVAADFNHDGFINEPDLFLLQQAWAATTRPPQDLNADGVVNILDLSVFLNRYTPTP